MLGYLQMFPETMTTVQRYSPEDRCYLYEAMMVYAFTEQEPDWPESDLKWLIWEALRQSVIRREESIKRKQTAGRASAEQRNATRANTSQHTSTQVNTPQHSGTERNPNTNTNTDTDTDTDIKRKRRRFTPPTREEVAAYIAEKGYCVDPDRWMAHYTSNGWKVGKNTMVDWKAAVRTWASNSVDSKPQSKPRPVIAQQYSQRDYSGEAEINDLLDWRNEQEGSA